MAKKVKNILIIGHSNIGDVCYDVVVINPLRKHFPQAKISFLTSSIAKNIVQGYEGLDGVIIFDKSTKDKGLFGRLRLLGALIRRRFDLIVVLKSTLMYKFLGVSYVWSVRNYLRSKPFKKRIHIADVYLAFLRFYGVNAQETVFSFVLGQEEKNFCNAFFAKKTTVGSKDRFIAILPGAAWPVKSWPLDKWNQLAQRLKSQHGIRVINVGKNSNNSFGQMISKNISCEIISADKTSLRQAMVLAKCCSLFIGPDSSLLHLVSCLGVEVIGLYGPTSKEYFYPYFQRHNIITSKKNRKCLPCYPDFKLFPCKGKAGYGYCMEDISVDDVLALVSKKLKLEAENKKNRNKEVGTWQRH